MWEEEEQGIRSGADRGGVLQEVTENLVSRETEEVGQLDGWRMHLLRHLDEGSEEIPLGEWEEVYSPLKEG